LETFCRQFRLATVGEKAATAKSIYTGIEHSPQASTILNTVTTTLKQAFVIIILLVRQINRKCNGNRLKAINSSV
jgi:hypothetical protein